jgi:hypothetical protein
MDFMLLLQGFVGIKLHYELLDGKHSTSLEDRKYQERENIAICIVESQLMSLLFYAFFCASLKANKQMQNQHQQKNVKNKGKFSIICILQCALLFR